MANKLAAVWPYLDERQRRLLVAAEAQSMGRGGISRVALAAGVSRPTVYHGLRELQEGASEPTARARRAGGGRKRVADKDAGLLGALDGLVEPTTRGDPMSPLRWTCKSTRQLAKSLSAAGHPVSSWTVGELLHEQHYSLQANVKTREGTQHPDRDAQFHYLNARVQSFLAASLPVVSVDAKKKELVGNYKNSGREWQPRGRPDEVQVHDFPDPAVGKAIPYGIYDVGLNAGWVTVGQDHDTASFAVESLRRWWRQVGTVLYPYAEDLLICADAGGSNGYRVRLWKVEIGRWASEAGLRITVCHLPPGTSKWNKIEHRLFSHISMNWRGRPLESHEVVVELIGATTTSTGLQVQAQRDVGVYPTSVKVSDEEFAAVPTHPHVFHGEWNYTILPAASP